VSLSSFFIHSKSLSTYHRPVILQASKREKDRVGTKINNASPLPIKEGKCTEGGKRLLTNKDHTRDIDPWGWELERPT
jgi:hypothetical protein